MLRAILPEFKPAHHTQKCYPNHPTQSTHPTPAHALQWFFQPGNSWRRVVESDRRSKELSRINRKNQPARQKWAMVPRAGLDMATPIGQTSGAPMAEAGGRPGASRRARFRSLPGLRHFPLCHARITCQSSFLFGSQCSLSLRPLLRTSLRDGSNAA